MCFSRTALSARPCHSTQLFSQRNRMRTDKGSRTLSQNVKDALMRSWDIVKYQERSSSVVNFL